LFYFCFYNYFKLSSSSELNKFAYEFHLIDIFSDELLYVNFSPKTRLVNFYMFSDF